MNERVYTTIDKTTWGDGPWQNEPDKVQWKDAATGLPCLAKRTPESGHLCGYVGLPKGHPLYEVGYDNVRIGEDEWPDVHGGLTYAGHCQKGSEAEAVCHVPEPGEPDDVWWLGFDCAHSGDLSPGYAEFLGDRFPSHDRDTYRDLPYVRRECASLARQIATVAS